MGDLNDILSRIRADGSAGPVRQLAELAVDSVLARRVGDLVDEQALVTHMGDGIRAFVASDDAVKSVAARIDATFASLAQEHRPIRALAPAAVIEGLVAFARLPTTPSRESLLKIVDREPLRQLFRAQMIQALSAFGRRAASPVAESTIGRGLGGISKLALGSSGKNPFARVASAVSGEVERQVERRANEFADTAVVGILSGIVDQVTDPARRDDQAAMRSAVVEGLFELTGADLASAAKGNAEAQVGVVRAALRSWSADPDFAVHLRQAIAILMQRDASRPLGDVLADLALRDAVRAGACSWLARELALLVASDAFANWLRDLLQT